eukprot:41627_1
MQLQAGIVPNLNRSLSRYQNVKFFTGALDRQNILESLSSLGYCWYRDTNLHNDLFPQQELVDNEIDHSERVQSCLFGDNYRNKLMNYNIGTDARDQHQNSITMNYFTPMNSHESSHSFASKQLQLEDTHPFVTRWMCMNNYRIK